MKIQTVVIVYGERDYKNHFPNGIPVFLIRNNLIPLFKPKQFQILYDPGLAEDRCEMMPEDFRIQCIFNRLIGIFRAPSFIFGRETILIIVSSAFKSYDFS